MSNQGNCVAIGIFDGVHAGHQELLKSAKNYGKVIVLTFYPHPTVIFAPERTPMQLLPLEDRISQLRAHGADEVVVIEFTKEFAAKTADEFIDEILVKQLKNRYNDPTIHKRFVIGIDRAKMRLYDCEQTAQKDILDSGNEDEYNDYEDKKPKKSFEGFKF